MTTFTSSLPNDLWEKLTALSKKLNIPKNKIIKSALAKYMDEIERQVYIYSYKQLADDPDIVNMAEEGMEDYIRQLQQVCIPNPKY